MPLDFSAAPLQPFAHQRIDTQALLDHPFFFIASEMRTGKTKICIDAMQFLYELGVINTVLVVCPEPVRSVWCEPQFGQLRKHLWERTSARVTEYHAHTHQWEYGPESATPLRIVVTNYEYMRPMRRKDRSVDDSRFKKLLPLCTPKTLLILDESGAITNHSSTTYKACLKLRKKCGRIVLLNGTPFDTPLHLFAQGNILDESVLDCKYVTHFKARYAVMGGFKVGAKRVVKPDGRVVYEGGRPTQVVNWQALDDLERRFAPYIVRRLQSDLPDMPVKLPAVPIVAPLTPRTWRAYCDMRDELVVMFQRGYASTAPHAITKLMRLAQITSGFVGGIHDTGLDDSDDEPDETTVPDHTFLGTEKLDAVLWLIAQRREHDPNLKIVIWVRFRVELERLVAAMRQRQPDMIVAGLYGCQKKTERAYVLSLLKPESAPAGAVGVVGTLGTGSFGLDFSASHTNVNCSYDYSNRRFLQSGDRVYGPDQKHPISYLDIIATGPKGQRTIDHTIIAARESKQRIADLTTRAWIQALKPENEEE